MSAIKYRINGRDVSHVEFNAAIFHLDFKEAHGQIFDDGDETHKFPTGETVDLINTKESNEFGHKREVRIWSLTTNKEK